MDYEEYDPQKDGYIYNHFNEQNFQEGKKLNKARLQKELGLPVKENTMLIGIVSRMTSQKGFDLVAYIMDELLATEDVQILLCLEQARNSIRICSAILHKSILIKSRLPSVIPRSAHTVSTHPAMPF